MGSARKGLLASLTGPHLSLVISNLPPHLPMQPELPNSMLLWRIVALAGSLSVSFCNGPLNTPRPKSRHTSSEDWNLKSSLVVFRSESSVSLGSFGPHKMAIMLLINTNH